MSPLPPHQQLAAIGKWPVVGERSSVDADGQWTVDVAGLVGRPRTFTLPQLAALSWHDLVTDIHCVTRWSKRAMRFGGVPLAAVLDHCGALPEARFVSFVARTERRHSTSLPLAQARSLGTLLAMQYEGGPIAAEHGGPVRTIAPGRYFYKSLKWLARIELLSDERLGYWEAEAGYHNVADPWREERFIASSLTRQDAARLLSTRDVSGREMLGLAAAGLALPGLAARQAILRNADFSGCDLAGADFTGANLSGSHFVDAQLRGATFANSQLEGVDFAGADLTGCNLVGASLLGASFGDENRPARLDRTTRFGPGALDDLASTQQALVRARIVLD